MVLLLCPASQAAPRHGSVREYTHQLVRARWHSEQEWRAVLEIVGAEGHWDPCSYFPSKHDCRYRGSNSCGFMQRNPCPEAWRGRLWAARYEQAKELVRYISRRYGTPSAALRFRQARGYY